MQIDPRNGVTPAGVRRPTGPTAEPAPPAAADPAAQATTSFTPTPALLGLLAHLAHLPDVRPDAVRHAAELVRRGDPLTPAAALQTARAILGAEPLPG